MTTILDLPVYGTDITAANNEDLREAWECVDQAISGVTIYNGGNGFGGPGFTGTLPAIFSLPDLGYGRPAVGSVVVVNGVVTTIIINDGGDGYSALSAPTLSIPGEGSGLVVSIAVGNPLVLDGIPFILEVRATPADKVVLLNASTTFGSAGGDFDGAIIAAGNLLGVVVLESAMRKLPPGSYVFEVRGQADGATKVVVKGNFIVGQGVTRERD